MGGLKSKHGFEGFSKSNNYTQSINWDKNGNNSKEKITEKITTDVSKDKSHDFADAPDYDRQLSLEASSEGKTEGDNFLENTEVTSYTDIGREDTYISENERNVLDVGQDGHENITKGYFRPKLSNMERDGNVWVKNVTGRITADVIQDIIRNFGVSLSHDVRQLFLQARSKVMKEWHAFLENAKMTIYTDYGATYTVISGNGFNVLSVFRDSYGTIMTDARCSPQFINWKIDGNMWTTHVKGKITEDTIQNIIGDFGSSLDDKDRQLFRQARTKIGKEWGVFLKNATVKIYTDNDRTYIIKSGKGTNVLTVGRDGHGDIVTDWSGGFWRPARNVLLKIVNTGLEHLGTIVQGAAKIFSIFL